jgi:hypothetical protein
MNDLRSLQFVDTNVLIYAHDVSAGDKHIRSRELIEELWAAALGCLSVQVLQEFYVNVTEKVAQPLSSREAAQIVSDLSAWQVHRWRRGCPGGDPPANQMPALFLGCHDRSQRCPARLRYGLVRGFQRRAGVRRGYGRRSILATPPERPCSSLINVSTQLPGLYP